MAEDREDVPGDETDEAAEPADDAEIPPEDDEDKDSDSTGRKRALKLRLPRKALIAAAAGIVLIASAATAVLFLFGDGDQSGTATLQLSEPPVFRDLPVMVADLKTDRCRSPYLKVQIVLEIPGNQVSAVRAKETEIMDAVQAQLREHERQDLVGKGGTEKLRREILTIVNGFIAPAQALGVLFKEFLLQ